MLERPVVFSSIATFHHAEFASLDVLDRARAAQGVSVSLCVPCLNEEDTIGDVVRILRSELVEKIPLVAEIAVVDSGSTDRSREVAEAAGADVYLASEILPRLFTPFQSTKSSGFGLGLAISSEIMSGLKGTIAADPPRPGEGATFRLIFPCPSPSS